MNTKLVFAGLASAAMLIPLASALDLSPDGVEELLPAELNCEDGVTEVSIPDILRPGVIMHVSILCAGTEAPDSHWGTDCPGDSWSHWIGPIANTMTYQYATSNPYGFTQAQVDAAWDGANTVFDAQVSASLFGGNTFGGSGSNVGVGNGVNQAGFKSMGGQLRNAIAVQYAWSSGGKIIESDSGYNTRFSYSIGAVSGKYDLQSIAAQEFGHGYGLGHSDTSSSSTCLSLYPYGTTGTTMGRTLGDGDITSIKNRYP